MSLAIYRDLPMLLERMPKGKSFEEDFQHCYVIESACNQWMLTDIKSLDVSKEVFKERAQWTRRSLAGHATELKAKIYELRQLTQPFKNTGFHNEELLKGILETCTKRFQEVRRVFVIYSIWKHAFVARKENKKEIPLGEECAYKALCEEFQQLQLSICARMCAFAVAQQKIRMLSPEQAERTVQGLHMHAWERSLLPYIVDQGLVGFDLAPFAKPLVELMLKYRIGIQERSVDGTSALQLICKWGKGDERVQEEKKCLILDFLRAGADIRDLQYGEDSLFFLLVQFMLDEKKNFPLLESFFNAIRGDKERVKNLLTQKNSAGKTPVEIAQAKAQKKRDPSPEDVYYDAVARLLQSRLDEALKK